MKKLHYGWVMVACAIGILAVHALTFYSFGIFLRPITGEFNWERGALSLALSLASLIAAPVSILAGRLSDRYGPRLLLTLSGLLTGIGFILVSQISALWQVYLVYGSVIAIGSGACVVPLTSTIARWFVQKRGLALGLTWAGIGVGGVLAPILTQWLISSYSWRWAYAGLGILMIVIIIPLAQFIKRNPEQVGLKPYGETDAPSHQPASGATGGFSFREAAKTRQLWVIGVIFACLFFIGQIMMSQIAAHAIDTGISAAIAASIISIFAAFSLLGRTTCGVLTDRMGGQRTMLLGFTMVSVALIWLLFAGEVWMFYLFAILYGIGFGIAVPLQTLLPEELFGLKSLGAIAATSMSVASFGGVVGAPLAGAIFDITGSYRIAFLICLALAILAIMLTVFLLPRRRKAKVNIGY